MHRQSTGSKRIVRTVAANLLSRIPCSSPIDLRCSTGRVHPPSPRPRHLIALPYPLWSREREGIPALYNSLLPPTPSSRCSPSVTDSRHPFLARKHQLSRRSHAAYGILALSSSILSLSTAWPAPRHPLVPLLSPRTPPCIKSLPPPLLGTQRRSCAPRAGPGGAQRGVGCSVSVRCEHVTDSYLVRQIGTPEDLLLHRRARLLTREHQHRRKTQCTVSRMRSLLACMHRPCVVSRAVPPPPRSPLPAAQDGLPGCPPLSVVCTFASGSPFAPLAPRN